MPRPNGASEGNLTYIYRQRGLHKLGSIKLAQPCVDDFININIKNQDLQGTFGTWMGPGGFGGVL